MWTEGAKEEIDSEIKFYDMRERSEAKYVLSNEIAFIKILTVCALQICRSRLTSKLHVRFSEGPALCVVTLAFKCESKMKSEGEISISDSVPHFEFSAEAMDFVQNTATAVDIHMKLYKNGDFFYLDLIFGKQSDYSPTIGLHSISGEIFRSTFTSSLELF